VIPHRVIAGHHADLGMTQTIGVDSRTGALFHFVGGPQGGGWGATAHADGQSATICVNDGDTHNAPIEVTEAKTPEITVEEYCLRQDSGGAGRYRGGLGTRLKVRTNAPGRVSAWMERTSCAPWGLDGGQPGSPNAAWVHRTGGRIEAMHGGKLDGIPLAPGDCHVIELGGGGGFGTPFDRDPEHVLADVRAGYVSREAALEQYRVALADAASGLTVDATKTHELRTERGEQA
jgi:N-methylhydantoinase B